MKTITTIVKIIFKIAAFLVAMFYSNGFELIVMLTILYIPVIFIYSKLEQAYEAASV